MKGQFSVAQLEFFLWPFKTLVNKVEVLDFQFYKLYWFNNRITRDFYQNPRFSTVDSEPAHKNSTHRIAACPLQKKRFFVGKIERV